MAVVQHVSQFSTLQIINMKNVGHAEASRQNISQCINIRHSQPEPHTESACMRSHRRWVITASKSCRFHKMSSAPDSMQTSYYEARDLPQASVGFTFIRVSYYIMPALWLRRSVFGLHSALGIAQWETAHRERRALSNNKKEQFNAPADLIKRFFPLYQLPRSDIYTWRTPAGRQQQQHKSESIFISGFLFVIIFIRCSLPYPRRLFICLRKTLTREQCFYLNV